MLSMLGSVLPSEHLASMVTCTTRVMWMLVECTPSTDQLNIQLSVQTAASLQATAIQGEEKHY